MRTGAVAWHGAGKAAVTFVQAGHHHPICVASQPLREEALTPWACLPGGATGHPGQLGGQLTMGSFSVLSLSQMVHRAFL